jgi:hypothetical protein
MPSKVAFDPEEPSLGRIRADSITPPHTRSSILRHISRVEATPALASSLLFSDIYCDTPLTKGHLAIIHPECPGLSPDKPMAIVQVNSAISVAIRKSTKNLFGAGTSLYQLFTSSYVLVLAGAILLFFLLHQLVTWLVKSLYQLATSVHPAKAILSFFSFLLSPLPLFLLLFFALTVLYFTLRCEIPIATVLTHN